jgi:hypothetical protein
MFTAKAQAPTAAKSVPQAVVATAPAQSAAKTGESNRPSHNLSAKFGDGELVKLTGLFAGTSKAGSEYLSVKITDTITIPAGSTIFLFKNTPKA